MKNYFKITILMLITIVFYTLVGCGDERDNNIIKQNSKFLDECLIVRGENGELLDLHIVGSVSGEIVITTNKSSVKNGEEKTPDFIIIADDVEFYNNSFILPELETTYWVFEATIGDLNLPKAADGGGKISANCDCHGSTGNCTISWSMLDSNTFVARCDNASENPCNFDGEGSCLWTYPVSNIQDKSKSEKATTIIIKSENIEYNGLLYE